MISPQILQKSPQHLIQTQRYATDADDVDPDIWPLINLHPPPLLLAAACSTSQQICTATDLQMFSTPDASSADFHIRMFPRLILTHGCFLGHPRMFPQLLPAPDVSYQHIMPTDDCRFTFPIAGSIRYLHQKRFSIHTIWQLPPASIQWRWEDEDPVGFIRHFSSVFSLDFKSGESIPQNVKQLFYWKWTPAVEVWWERYDLLIGE